MELLLIFCVSSDGHTEDVLCNVRGGMMILEIKLPILSRKLVTHTSHDMVLNGLLPKIFACGRTTHAQVERKAMCSYYHHRATISSDHVHS
jgi:hypothetical protein